MNEFLDSSSAQQGQAIGGLTFGVSLGALSGKSLGNIDSLSVPQGLTRSQFAEMSNMVRSQAGYISDDIFVHGSRASGTATAASDIDIGLRVSPEKFSECIGTCNFGNIEYPSVENLQGNSNWRTMQRAVESGKIQRGEAGLSSLGKELQNLLDLNKVDISIIKSGGPFDNGPFINLW